MGQSIQRREICLMEEDDDALDDQNPKNVSWGMAGAGYGPSDANDAGEHQEPPVPERRMSWSVPNL